MGIMDFIDEPIPSYYFEVSFIDSNPGVMAMVSNIVQMFDSSTNAFQAVSGLKMSYSTEKFNEAGWAVPRATFTKVEAEPVVLTRYLRLRYMLPLDPLSDWCKETMTSTKIWDQRIKKKDVIISIYHPLGPSKMPVAGFLLLDAYPTAWSITDLDSVNDSEPIKEIVSLEYTEMKRMKF